MSKWSSSDSILEHGFMLKDLTVPSIGEAIEWTKSLSDQDMEKLIRKNHAYVMEKHNKSTFKSQFKNNLKALIEA